MLAKLFYDPNAWTANVLIADLKSLINGETDVANLSVDAGNSEIVTTTAIGWSMHDDIDATQFVIKAPLTDDGAQFKYIHIFTSGALVKCILFETWDNVSHAGTNPAVDGGGTHINQESSVAQGVTLYISMSVAHFYATSLNDNNTNTSSTPTFISEHTRDAEWDTPAEGYLPVIQCTDRYSWPYSAVTMGHAGGTYGSNTLGQWTRQFSSRHNNDQFVMRGQMVTPFGSNTNLAASGGTGISAGGVSTSMYSDYYTPNGKRELRIPFGITSPEFSYVGGNLTAKCGIYFSNMDSGVVGDEVEMGGTLYVIIREGQSTPYCMLIPKT